MSGSRSLPTSWLVSGMGFQASQMKVEGNRSLLETDSGTRTADHLEISIQAELEKKKSCLALN